MAKVTSTKDLLLHLLYVRGLSDKLNDPIIGTTRLQKLVFLFEREIWSKFKLDKFISKDALPDFQPYNFGPFSRQVVEDVDFLQSIDFIKVTSVKIEIADQVAMMELESRGKIFNENTLIEEYVYTLTDLGVEFVSKGNAGNLSENQLSILSEFKKRSTAIPLRALLVYVYKTYPDMTINSKIKDKILSESDL